MSELADIEIESYANGTGKVIVNGEDLSQVCTGFSYQCEPGQAPVLAVRQVAGSAAIKGKGVVHVGVESDDAMSIVEFLDSIDPELLEAATLARISFDQSATPMMLEILKEWAGGTG